MEEIDFEIFTDLQIFGLSEYETFNFSCSVLVCICVCLEQVDGFLSY
jgi:hypothetical protein